MIRTHDLLLLGAHVLLVAGVSPCMGQRTQPMRFDPSAATRVHTIISSEIVIDVLEGSTDHDEPRRLAARRLESVTRFVDDVGGEFYSIMLQYDSVRAWVEKLGSLWAYREVADRELESVRAVVDGRMQVVTAEFVNRTHLGATRSELVRGLGGGIHVTLPEGGVSPGSTWTTEIGVSLMVLSELDVPENIPTEGEILGSAHARLDSVTIVPGDTISFLTLWANLEPGSFRSAAGRTRGASVDGWVSATMVWSASWDAFVTGAVRTVVELDAYDTPDRTGRSRVRFDVTTQFQVRL